MGGRERARAGAGARARARARGRARARARLTSDGGGLELHALQELRLPAHPQHPLQTQHHRLAQPPPPCSALYAPPLPQIRPSATEQQKGITVAAGKQGAVAHKAAAHERQVRGRHAAQRRQARLEGGCRHWLLLQGLGGGGFAFRFQVSGLEPTAGSTGVDCRSTQRARYTDILGPSDTHGNRRKRRLRRSPADQDFRFGVEGLGFEGLKVYSDAAAASQTRVQGSRFGFRVSDTKQATDRAGRPAAV